MSSSRLCFHGLPALGAISFPDDIDPDVNELLTVVQLLPREVAAGGVMVLGERPETDVTARVFALAHENIFAGHMGVDRSIARYVRFTRLPGIKHDMAQAVLHCAPCQRCMTTPNVAPTFASTAVEAPFQNVFLDHLRPLPKAQGMSYVLVAIDRFSGWVEAIAVPDLSAATTARAIYARWIGEHGTPAVITTDGASAFDNATIAAVCAGLKTTHRVNTAHHPPIHDAVERAKRTLLETLRVLLAAPGNTATWPDRSSATMPTKGERRPRRSSADWATCPGKPRCRSSMNASRP